MAWYLDGGTSHNGSVYERYGGVRSCTWGVTSGGFLSAPTGLSVLVTCVYQCRLTSLTPYGHPIPTYLQ